MIIERPKLIRTKKTINVVVDVCPKCGEEVEDTLTGIEIHHFECVFLKQQKRLSENGNTMLFFENKDTFDYFLKYSGHNSRTIRYDREESKWVEKGWYFEKVAKCFSGGTCFSLEYAEHYYANIIKKAEESIKKANLQLEKIRNGMEG